MRPFNGRSWLTDDVTALVSDPHAIEHSRMESALPTELANTIGMLACYRATGFEKTCKLATYHGETVHRTHLANNRALHNTGHDRGKRGENPRRKILGGSLRCCSILVRRDASQFGWHNQECTKR